MPLAAILFPFVLFGIRSWWEIGFIVGALALWTIIATCREKIRKYRSRNWPATTGAVGQVTARLVDGGVNGVDYWKVTFTYTYAVQQQHTATYSLNCTSEAMKDGAVAGLQNKTVSVHYPPSNEAKPLLWEDEIWDIWWDTYWDAKSA